MEKFKSERNWSDIDKASKKAMAVGVVVWLMLVYGLYKSYTNFNQIKSNVAKTEMVRTR